MSLILEALRKSEAERRRGAMPNLYAESPPAPVRSRPAMQQVLVVGAAAFLLLAVWWLRERTQAARDFVRVPAAETHDAPAAPALPPVQHLTPPTAPAVAPPAAAPTAVSNKAITTPSEADDALPPPPDFAKPVVPPASIKPIARTTDGRATDGLMTLSDLSVDERNALPALRMSMHMWNEAPAQRFVILDGNRLQEGDRVGGAVLTAIVPDGAILDWNGRRLKLTIR